jgi:hypothetical protein
MRATTFLACGVAALLLAAPAGAADRAKVSRMLDAMRMAESMDAMKHQQLDAMGAEMMADCLKRGSSQARCDEAVPQLLAPVGRAFDVALSWDGLREEMVALYAEALTDAEVDAAIAHYTTPEGQSLLAKLPLLVQRGAALGEKRMATVAPTLRKELGAVASKLAAEDAAREAKAAGPALPAEPLNLDVPEPVAVPEAPPAPAVEAAPPAETTAPAEATPPAEAAPPVPAGDVAPVADAEAEVDAKAEVDPEAEVDARAEAEVDAAADGADPEH